MAETTPVSPTPEIEPVVSQTDAGTQAAQQPAIPAEQPTKTFSFKQVVILFLVVALVGGLGVFAYNYVTTQNSSSSAAPTTMTETETGPLDVMPESEYETYTHPNLPELTFKYPATGKVSVTLDEITDPTDAGTTEVRMDYMDLVLTARVLQGLGGLETFIDQPYEIIAGDYTKGIGRITDSSGDDVTQVQYFSYQDGGAQFGGMLGSMHFSFLAPTDRLPEYQPIMDTIATSALGTTPNPQAMWGRVYFERGHNEQTLYGISESGESYEIQSVPRSEAWQPLFGAVNPTGEFLVIYYQNPDQAPLRLGFYDFTDQSMLFMSGMMEASGTWTSDYEFTYNDADIGATQTINVRGGE